MLRRDKSSHQALFLGMPLESMSGVQLVMKRYIGLCEGNARSYVLGSKGPAGRRDLRSEDPCQPV